MKRDRLGRFLSPGTAGQRGGAGGSGRTRGRPARSGPSVDEAAALVAARLGWGLARARGDTGEDGADEAGGSGRAHGGESRVGGRSPGLRDRGVSASASLDRSADQASAQRRSESGLCSASAAPCSG